MFSFFNPFQMKTVSVALVLCLNVGVDPPDVVKTSPCARLECWIGKRLRHLIVFCIHPPTHTHAHAHAHIHMLTHALSHSPTHPQASRLTCPHTHSYSLFPLSIWARCPSISTLLYSSICVSSSLYFIHSQIHPFILPLIQPFICLHSPPKPGSHLLKQTHND